MSLLYVLFFLVMLFVLPAMLLIALRIYSKLTAGRCKCKTYLAGKTVLITGGNSGSCIYLILRLLSGLGYQTALALAGRGCRLIIADKDNCDYTKQEIIKITGNSNIVTKQFNLASFNSIRKLAKDINKTEERLDILINNAGIGVGSIGNVYTDDGFHMGMQVNHFGPFLLTHLLIELLKKSSPSRIIFVSSWLAFANNLDYGNLNYPQNAPDTLWSDLMVYGNSKLCNIITANEFSKKLSGTGITVNTLHPGLVNTPIFTKCDSVNTSCKKLLIELLLYCFAKDVEEGAQTTIHLALSKEGGEVTGQFFSDCRVFPQPSKTKDHLFAHQIWKTSEEYVKLCPEEKF